MPNPVTETSNYRSHTTEEFTAVKILQEPNPCVYIKK